MGDNGDNQNQVPVTDLAAALETQGQELARLQQQLAMQNGGPARSCKLPPVWKESLEGWFAHAESMMACHGVTADEMRYNLIVTALDAAMTRDLLDVLQDPPAEGKYERLKAQVLARFGLSAEQRLRTLYSGIQTEGRKPSSILHEMRRLAGTSIDDAGLKVRWLDVLPPMSQQVLRVMRNASLQELAEAADELYKLPGASVSAVRQGSRGTSPARTASTGSSISGDIADLRAGMAQLLSATKLVLEAVTASTQFSRPGSQQSGRGRSRSRGSGSRSASPAPNGHCYYHYRFGASAERCRQPCTFVASSAPKN
ncbi:uncharacterized protein LOC131675709 [Phymastichus coffea]|uniref:uncharacterized protein LOC131675709 n=1 Tax=Phymastichus coffea TaxID=108790 RepID=UPI00273A95C3|nr:uncharacterized protein LOC131675709 [Phymastichus coffea]